MGWFCEFWFVFVCWWVPVLGGVGFLVVFGKLISIIFTFVRVGDVDNLSSVGSKYIVSVCGGAVRVPFRSD